MDSNALLSLISTLYAQLVASQERIAELQKALEADQKD